MRAIKLGHWMQPLAAGAACVAASVLLPTLVITAYALGSHDTRAVTAFATRVAEPLALGAALLTTGIAALWASAGATRRIGRGAVVGSAAAAFMAAAALHVGDVDSWTGAAVVMLPLVGMLGGALAARSRRRIEAAGVRGLVLGANEQNIARSEREPSRVAP